MFVPHNFISLIVSEYCKHNYNPINGLFVPKEFPLIVSKTDWIIIARWIKCIHNQYGCSRCYFMFEWISKKNDHGVIKVVFDY